MYRTWWAQRKVDGVFLVDLQVGDRRIRVLEELSMPAVVIGTPRGAGSLPAVWQDDGPPPRPSSATWPGSATGGSPGSAVSPGTGTPSCAPTRSPRSAGAAGIEAISVAADYTAEHGAEATRDLLKQAAPPTAILYDNDLMALAGLGAAQRMGVRVPADLSIVVWDDSALCELVHPRSPR